MQGLRVSHGLIGLERRLGLIGEVGAVERIEAQLKRHLDAASSDGDALVEFAVQTADLKGKAAPDTRLLQGGQIRQRRRAGDAAWFLDGR